MINLARVAAEAGVKVITTGAGNPGKYMEFVEKTPALWCFPVVPGVALARRLEAAGAPMGVIAEGDRKRRSHR